MPIIPEADYVPVDGATMTGPLILSGDPLTGLQAASKQYVDGLVSAACGTCENVEYFSKNWWYADGTPASNVRAAVFEEDQSTLVPIFSDAGLTTPLPNPTTTQPSGLFEFYAAPGTYWVAAGDIHWMDSVRISIGPSGTGDPVLSVNGQTGVVVLDAADVGADPAGSAAAAQAAAIAASDPLGSAAAAQAAAIASSLQKSANLSDLSNAATARTNLGLGTAAITDTGTGPTNTILGNDARLTDSRTPTAHASTHASAGSDPVTLAQSQITGLVTDLGNKQPLDSDLTAIAALTPANDDIIQRKAGVWTNRSVAQFQADMTPANPLAIQPRAGGFTQAGGVVVTRSAMTPSLFTMFLTPFVLRVPATLAALALELTNSTPSASLRLGIYSSTAALMPGNLLADFGNFIADTAGVVAAFPSQALNAEVYWSAVAIQGAAPELRFGSGWNPYVSAAFFPTGTDPGWQNSYYQSVVAGGLPATPTIDGATNAPLIALGF